MKKDVGFLEAFKLFWTNYVNFRGRSRRKEYWYVVLWMVIIYLLYQLLNIVAAVTFAPLIIIIALVFIVFSLGTIIPNLALKVRRFHDVSFSTWVPITIFVVKILTFVIVYAFAITIKDPEALNASSSKIMESNLIPLWLLIIATLINLALSIFELVVACMNSKKGTNKYGPNPKEVQDYNHEYYNDGFDDNQRDLSDRFDNDDTSEKSSKNNQEKYHY